MTSYRYTRNYHGSIQAVILDFAGTTVDFGSCAPIRAFLKVFSNNKIAVTKAEARAPMGSEKRAHIATMLAMPRVAEAWEKTHQSPVTEETIDRLYQEYIPLQVAAIKDSAELIPGCAEAIADMRVAGYKIGANTGYNREMASTVAELAAQAGYTPDSVVCAEDVSKGRPFPYMALLNAMQLGVENLAACVKVDDTVVGIEEGLNAGMWTIAVAVSGNEAGCTLEEWNALDEAEQNNIKEAAYQKLSQSGAHYIIDSIADIMECLAEIEERLALGEKP